MDEKIWSLDVKRLILNKVMKKSKEDIEFMQLLQDNTPKPNENPWFTRKVMNRLPYRQSTASLWVTIIGYGLCAVIGAFCWGIFFGSLDYDMITKGDGLMFLAMLAFSGYLIFMDIRGAIKHSDRM